MPMPDDNTRYIQCTWCDFTCKATEQEELMAHEASHFESNEKPLDTKSGETDTQRSEA